MGAAFLAAGAAVAFLAAVAGAFLVAEAAAGGAFSLFSLLAAVYRQVDDVSVECHTQQRLCRNTHLLHNLDLSTSTLGLVKDTDLDTSGDGLVDVVQVGGRRHVQLVLVSQEPGRTRNHDAKIRNPDVRCRDASETHFLMAGRETP